jgi:hypothetical protein
VSQQSLLDELGLDEQTLTWRQLALCGGRNGEGMDINLFFDDYEDDKDLAVSMDEVCLSCPVMIMENGGQYNFLVKILTPSLARIE